MSISGRYLVRFTSTSLFVGFLALTVVGPAVNEASRVAAMRSEFERRTHRPRWFHATGIRKAAACAKLASTAAHATRDAATARRRAWMSRISPGPFAPGPKFVRTVSRMVSSKLLPARLRLCCIATHSTEPSTGSARKQCFYARAQSKRLGCFWRGRHTFDIDAAQQNARSVAVCDGLG